MMEFGVQDIKFSYLVEKRQKLMSDVYRTRNRRIYMHLKLQSYQQNN